MYRFAQVIGGKDSMNRRYAAILIGVVLFLTGCSRSTTPATGALPQNPSLYVVRMDPALDAVIAPGTSIEKVAGGFQFTEGPMWHGGRLWFSDVVGNKMYAMSPDGAATLLLADSGGLKNVPAKSFPGFECHGTGQDWSCADVSARPQKDCPPELQNETYVLHR